MTKLSRTAVRILLPCLALSITACGDAPTGPGEPMVGAINIQQTDLRLTTGDVAQLTVRDQDGNDVTQTAEWSVADASTAHVTRGRVEAIAPGMTFVSAAFGGALDSVQVVVSFQAEVGEGLALRIQQAGSDPLQLTGAAFLHARLGPGPDILSMTAIPGEFDPLAPPGLDFAIGAGTRIHMLHDGAPVVGSRRLQSWTVTERPDGGFGLQGQNGVAIWREDPNDPNQIEFFVSVGEYTLEFDRVELPSLAGLPSGVLVGRLAFDAAGLIVRLDGGPPRIVGQIGTETVAVFAEFSVALRLFPIGNGTIGIQGGPFAFETVPFGAPQASRYRDGLVLDYSIAVPAADGTPSVYANQFWIGSPAVGTSSVNAADASNIESRDAYAPGTTWVWSGSGTDPQAVFRAKGDVNAFSSGGTLTIEQYVPSDAETFGLVAGTFEISEAFVASDGTSGTQTLTGTFEAPITPTSLSPGVVPIVDIVEQDNIPPDPARLRLGNGGSGISGRVIEDDYLAVSGVTVRVSGPSGGGEVISNRFGLFWIDGLDAGDYTIEFDVPDGRQLAQGQLSSISPLRVGDNAIMQLDLNLADAEGNGSLRVMASDSDGHTLLDGVHFVIREEASGVTVADLITGTERFGAAIAKIQPGRYTVTATPPDGFVLREGYPNPVVVQIAKGHLQVRISPFVRG